MHGWPVSCHRSHMPQILTIFKNEHVYFMCISFSCVSTAQNRLIIRTPLAPLTVCPLLLSHFTLPCPTLHALVSPWPCTLPCCHHHHHHRPCHYHCRYDCYQQGTTYQHIQPMEWQQCAPRGSGGTEMACRAMQKGSGGECCHH